MMPPDDDESTSLLGEALAKLMACDDGQSEDPIQIGNTMTFHRYMDLPPDVREMIRTESIDQEYVDGINDRVDWFHPVVTNHDIARLAPVSKEWQEHIEAFLFGMIRIDPLVDEEVSKFKEQFKFKKHRRRHLQLLEIIVDDRSTGPWHVANGILQISLTMEKLGQLFTHVGRWKSRNNGPLRINFVSLDLDFPEVRFAPKGEPSIKTSSLWTDSQLDLLTTSNLATDMPLRAIWSAFPKKFRIATCLTFPLDCVPLPATIAIMEKMPNLESCFFELSLKRSSEEGMARLTDFVQQLPTLLPSLRELTIRATDADSAPEHVTASANGLSVALRDDSENFGTLKIEGIFMQQNFFESFGVDRDLVLGKLEWNWPNLERLSLQFVTFGPCPGPFSKPNQLTLTPAELLIAAGRATIAMPALQEFRVSMYDASEDTPPPLLFYVKRELPGNLKILGSCLLKLLGFDPVQEQEILHAWGPFIKAEARFVSEEDVAFNWDDEGFKGEPFVEPSHGRVYKTFPEEYKLSHTFGAAALVHNAKFLEAQRLARADSGLPSVAEV